MPPPTRTRPQLRGDLPHQRRVRRIRIASIQIDHCTFEARESLHPPEHVVIANGEARSPCTMLHHRAALRSMERTAQADRHAVIV